MGEPANAEAGRDAPATAGLSAVGSRHAGRPSCHYWHIRTSDNATPLPDFGDVYDEHVWRIYGYFAYRLRRRDDVEDLTQLTFERALRAWRRYDPSQARIDTWLLVIARNLLIDHLRADRSARNEPLETRHDAMPADPQHVSLGIEPDLEYALGKLDHRERELIALRFGNDLCGPEIAELTGLSLANVQQILSRALRRMRAAMDTTPAGGRSR